MSTYNKIIKIQKLNEDMEIYEDYYSCHANVNKSSGKEYFNARVEISTSTFNFKLRYCEKLKDIVYNSELYRIIYNGKNFNVKTTDDYKEKHHELTIVGDYNSK